MKSITIQGTKRESVGKKSTKALRDAELVPCVVYGGGAPLNFSAEERAFKGLVYTPEAHTVSIEVDGQTIPAVLQDIQFHPITDKILHADFYQLADDKPVVMEVPVRITGRSKGVVAGGVLRQSFRKLKVKAIPANLPDEVVVDVTPLRIGNKLYIGGIKAEGYTFMHPDNAVVVAVKMSRNAMKGGAAAEDDEDEEEAAEVATQSPDVPTTEEKSAE
ncbi:MULTISPECIES: 50S ribosomal protein L25/general stress protein Ctc [Chryseobacterium]|jgi:large subunit ribosomal protein L25|uniref:Large ribosomal subunit protein bL25 n=1 Tax=Chryseobacterium rhizosphaerae TaxID=395937 RepID=A0ABX9IRF0_9FLAO|nr:MULTISPECIES: 50S ribosomal protein L25/general stress protein Ctc [Chryseobacterium]MBL3550072.1 50S ribosomal protein L25/general stress protein Ctc [Chryseobacterium sp. KMC2]MDC8102256.1 50S ribosomal protein L25/general stress protein Ctc [Chryseobacterium rhizosphaerae]REC78337.1 50S ribosomal protein L25/general stress protein Ctc [Chryseobacterium rhizosphaerae]SMC74887.1 large subunit ribosomal protein L25 [Chryseobacterium sp. YR221]GEN66625.1 50S ribosomal protein L25 [Chryseobac